MSGSGFERWWSTGDFRWSVSHGDVLVVLFGAALEGCVIGDIACYGNRRIREGA